MSEIVINNFKVIPMSFTKIEPPYLIEKIRSDLYIIYKSSFGPNIYCALNQKDQSYSAYQYIGSDVENDIVKFLEYLNVTHIYIDNN